MRTTRLIATEGETYDTMTFIFKDPEPSCPVSLGQCFMVWVPRVGEAPFGISHMGPGGEFGVTVQKKGKVTNALHDMVLGDVLGIKGPFGNGFTLPDSGDVWIVIGGIGAAPFGTLDPNLFRGGSKIIMGAKNKGDLLFEDRFKVKGLDLEICTDDGTKGYKGFVTDRFQELMGEGKPDMVLTCGPEVMLKKVVDICLENGIPVQASLERHMKCGMGICDICSIDGLQVCRDGPVFTGEVLKDLPEFGKYKRDPSGKRIPI
jgi:dihydroorotate dehydrogenase electron transfer subunit